MLVPFSLLLHCILGRQGVPYDIADNMATSFSLEAEGKLSLFGSGQVGFPPNFT